MFAKKQTSEKQINLSTYDNSRFGFKIDYPTDWKLGQGPSNSDGKEIISPDSQVVCRAYGFNNSLTNDAGQPQTLDQYVEWVVDAERQTNKDNSVKVVEKSQTELGSKSAMRLVLDNSGQISDSIYSLDNEKGFGFSCDYNNIDQRKEYLNSFDLMSRSFKIN